MCGWGLREAGGVGNWENDLAICLCPPKRKALYLAKRKRYILQSASATCRQATKTRIFFGALRREDEEKKKKRDREKKKKNKT